MTLMCRKCTKYTNHVDDSPCQKDCPEFSPMNVATIHYAEIIGGKIIPICNPRPAKNSNMQFTCVPYGHTCPLCINKLKELYGPKEPEPTPSLLQEVDGAPSFEEWEWETLGLPAHLQNQVQTLFSEKTVNEFRTFVLTTPDFFTEYGFTETDSEILLASLYLKRNE